MTLKTIPVPARIALCLFCFIASVAILILAKDVLVPLAFALVLAMLLIPLGRKLEKLGMGRGFAAFVCVLALILAFAIIFGLLGWQLSALIEDAGDIRKRIAEMGHQLQQLVSQKIGIKPQEQKEIIEKADMGAPVTFVAQGTGILLGIALDVLLALVYIFLLIFFREHFLQFVSRAVPADKQTDTLRIIREAGGISQQYLAGLATMIACLWVMYGIGFSAIGVKNAIFFAILCGTLEMVPFVGNIMGCLLTALITLATGGSPGLVVGILAIYGVVQFVQSYFLEPLVVGSGINLNPFFTIFGIVVGEAIWGIPGMVLALPLFGMLKIACDHFNELKPYGFLLGQEKKARAKK
ncbi:AI-2E family transporter [Mucilaginibacter antarcticus]|uniref:AI-2E family transporter n=1 Tax=Mucilaginibacter antarcticus TaxID=1855725 RepID=A0ABW5XNJ3_9SPHI